MKKLFYLICSVSLIVFWVSCQHDPLFDDMPPDGGGEPQDTIQDTIPNEPVGNPCSEDSVYFKRDVLPILMSNCAFVGCHGQGSAQDGVDLTSYQSVFETADVDPFDLDGSDLYEVITEDDLDKRMPPFPANALSAEQINIIGLWINQGALNNNCEECDTSSVGFNTSIWPIIQNHCMGCHSGSNAGGGILLTNYNQIALVAENGMLSGVINHETGFVPMPFNLDPLNDCKIEQIEIWIDNGALND